MRDWTWKDRLIGGSVIGAGILTFVWAIYIAFTGGAYG